MNEPADPGDHLLPEGRRAFRGRVFRAAVSLFLLPIMFIGAENIAQAGQDSLEYHAMEAAVSAAQGATVANASGVDPAQAAAAIARQLSMGVMEPTDRPVEQIAQFASIFSPASASAPSSVAESLTVSRACAGLSMLRL